MTELRVIKGGVPAAWPIIASMDGIVGEFARAAVILECRFIQDPDPDSVTVSPWNLHLAFPPELKPLATKENLAKLLQHLSRQLRTDVTMTFEFR